MTGLLSLLMYLGDNCRRGETSMKPVKVCVLAALMAVAPMAFVGTTTASALTSTQLCYSHTGLTCESGKATPVVHVVLKSGTVGKLLSPISVLCLGVLIEAGVGSGVTWGETKGVKYIIASAELSNPQAVQSTSWISFTGCGTGSAHDNCTVTVETLPAGQLLKVWLDAGSLEAVRGSIRLVCSNIGIDCLYDLEGSLYSAGAGHLVAEETPTTELGGKFFCPDEGFLDGDLVALNNVYVLG